MSQRHTIVNRMNQDVQVIIYRYIYDYYHKSNQNELLRCTVAVKGHLDSNTESGNSCDGCDYCSLKYKRCIHWELDSGGG